MATQFGECIRTLRTKHKLLLREVASELSMDTALLSKIERGDRPVKKEQIPLFAKILKSNPDELTTLWLADQVMNILKNENLADEVLKSVTKKLKKFK